MTEDKMLAFFAPNSVKKEKCPYRADKECKHKFPCNTDILDCMDICTICVEGQKADEMKDISSSIANLTASIEERLCKEERK